MTSFFRRSMPWAAPCLVATLAFQGHLPTLPRRHSMPWSSKTSLYSSSYNLASPTTIDISESAPRNIAPLYEWASRYGVQAADGFELVSDDGLDVYAMTNQYIASDSPIVCVPSELIFTGSKARRELCAESAEQTLIQSLPSEHLSEVSRTLSEFYLFAKVLAEFERGADGPWHAYLGSLPRFYCTGSSMTEFCFGCLPPYAASQALDERNRLSTFVRALWQVPYISDEGKSDAALTAWAYNVVRTRHHEMDDDGDLCLVPMADFFNHGGAESDVYIAFDDDGNCYARATTEVPAGQPLRLCYGDSTNPSQLLAKFGFLDESSPTTFCKYIVDDPSSAIFDMGYPAGMVFSTDGSISNVVWDVLLYQELGKLNNLQGQQQFYQAHMSGDEATKQNYHNEYFGQTYAELSRHVQYLLNELEELGMGAQLQAERGKDAEKHPRLPLLRRHNEYVKDVLERVQENLDGMVQ